MRRSEKKNIFDEKKNISIQSFLEKLKKLTKIDKKSTELAKKTFFPSVVDKNEFLN